jgi:hypothetical protein
VRERHKEKGRDGHTQKKERERQIKGEALGKREKEIKR